jgi:DNA-binding response OmpR family regulator
MPSSASGAEDSKRVGGARADFVASLGRKVNDARELLALLDDDPSSKVGRDELRRRLHALGAGARLLRFEAMTHSIQEALAVLDRGGQAGALREQDVTFVAQVLDDLPALAWGEIPSREPFGRAAGDSADDAPGPMPIAVLVVGDESLAGALIADAATRARAFECEHIMDADAALELARAYAPDLLLVDTDLPRAPELVEALLDDPLTDPVPVVVIGTFGAPEELARFVALGVARTLARPVTSELLRATCDEVVETRDGRTTRVTLGEPTLEQLADRLADELKRALVDSVDGPARSHRVPLGEGTEVLGALWGAIARVQEIVVQKTGGAIRFGGETPEGAIALAPSLHQDLPGADRLVGRGRGAAADVRLIGRRVVVADDDPGVTWFVSDLLRTAGCEVHEALDGATALDLAFRVQPDLVVSDILMPGLDGFALCRALRRDIALRDTPVILLSWKEDLLQRVRELGASAAAYMRKESGSRAILARVREVLRPRARVEVRLRGEGEVRGRLDGLTPRLLLELLCLIRKDARVSVRDATYLYEVEIRAGAPRKATRTASDGNYLSGERALASLLGVGAGRFVVMPGSAPIHGELTGTLFEQLLRPIAAARGALAATAGARTANVERILFDEQALEEYLFATPEPTRTLIRRLAQGMAPRQMLLGGVVSPSLLEDVLSDLAGRGAIRAVEGAKGVDLLTPAVDAALAVLRGAGEPRHVKPPNARSSVPARPTRATARAENDAFFDAKPSMPPPAAHDEGLALSAPPPSESEDDEGIPSSLEDAVMREISDRSAEPRASRAPTSDPPPIVEPSDLRPRSSSNPPMAAGEPEGADEAVIVPSVPPDVQSVPPDAVVPGTNISEEIAAASDSRSAPPAAWSKPDPGPPAESTPTSPASLAVGEPTGRGAPNAQAVVSPAPADRKSRPQEPDRGAPVAPAQRRRWGLLLPLGLVGVAVAALLRWSGDEQAPARAPSEVPPVTPSSTSSAAASTEAVPTPPPSASDDLPPGAEVPPGFGLVEVRAPARAVVRVDGKAAGSGPFVATVAAPGYHEVRIAQGARESTHVIEVRAGKVAHVGSAPLP